MKFSNLVHSLKSCSVGETVKNFQTGSILTVLEKCSKYVFCSVEGKQGRYAYSLKTKINKLKK